MDKHDEDFWWGKVQGWNEKRTFHYNSTKPRYFIKGSESDRTWCHVQCVPNPSKTINGENKMNKPSNAEIERLCTECICDDAPEYRLMTNPERTLFWAGCRHFTREEALDHWGRRHPFGSATNPEQLRAQLFYKAIKANPIRTIDTVKSLEAQLAEKLEAVEKVKAEIEAAKEKAKGGVFRPKYGEKYWAVGGFGIVGSTIDGNDTYDKHQLITSNVFRTEEEAQAHLDRLTELFEVNELIREANDGWVPDWSDQDSKCCICYDRVNSKLDWNYFIYLDTPMELDCIKSKEAAKSVIAKITQDQINKIWRLS